MEEDLVSGDIAHEVSDVDVPLRDDAVHGRANQTLRQVSLRLAVFLLGGIELRGRGGQPRARGFFLGQAVVHVLLRHEPGLLEFGYAAALPLRPVPGDLRLQDARFRSLYRCFSSPEHQIELPRVKSRKGRSFLYPDPFSDIEIGHYARKLRLDVGLCLCRQGTHRLNAVN